MIDRNVRLEDLSKDIYSDKLLEKLSSGNHTCLYDLSPAQREDREFMEPLLYAVKNTPECGGKYIVYKYYGENLQENLGLLIEVVSEDPSIIEGTPISRNREFMLDIAELRPSVIPYIDDSLKSDPEFIEELNELQDKGVDFGVALVQNPILANNAEFMKEAIKEDAKFLEFASEELKNNYDFIKEVTRENYKTVEYIVQNRDNFGLEGIKGAKETTRELTVEDYMAIIDDMAKKSNDARYQKVRDKVQEKGPNDAKVVKWITAMVAQNRDNVNIENFQKVFDNAILTMTKIQRDLNDNGEINLSLENAHELITPRILNELREAATEKGLEITPEQEKLFEEYEKFHKEYNSKWTEKKKQDRKLETLNITPKDIEAKTENARVSEINAETRNIREEYTRQTEEKEVMNHGGRGTDE